MKWTINIQRVSDNKTVKQVFRWEPSNRRSRGRPKEALDGLRWRRCGITIGRQRVSLQEMAVDRVNGRSWCRHRRL